MRAFQIGLSALLIGSAPAGAAIQPSSVPPALSSFLHNGVVEDGDYRWLRGRFADATDGDKQAFVTALKWNEGCENQSRAAMKDRLAAMGQTFDPGPDVYARPAPCRQFVRLPIPADVTWPAFSSALDRVRPYALGIIRATALVERQVIDHGAYAEQLRTRPMGEQALRFAWVESQRHEGQTATYSSLERIAYEGILLRALDDRDQANTAWLSAKVAHQGWPTRSTVGDEASSAAWLLVQHADTNPAFQLTALRLMAPLAAKDEIDPRNFAMLTDRVQLKLSGRQRYGTQWTCKGGKRVPLPLATTDAVTDALRATAKLGSLKANAAQIDTLYGPCPPEA
ncbi:DUF6624 domain-containing protein [Sphingomonas faeni]|uniref:DUF6624 domain-containing protein n=1 Tax=Sphingomonas faeni TaxID=185950 RepID=UPI0020C09479|nr:DUF6624 domain-containing protein [Sphingomonas faeni]MCK8455217.1 hypothetical protein [Sphingomonas faeni]